MLAAANLVVSAGFGAILPYLPVFLQEEAHASVRLIGVVAAAFCAGTLIFAPVFGRLSDGIGRKPLILLGLALFGVASLLFMTSTHPGWFVLFRFLQGVGAAALTPASLALVADLSTEETRSRAFGWINSGQFAGMAAGPVLAWPLYSLGGGSGKWAFYTIFLFGAALSLLTAVILLVAIREPERVRRQKRVKTSQPPYRRLISRPIAAFLVVAFTSNFAMGGWETLWSLYLRHLGASMRLVGVAWALPMVPMLFSWAAGYLSDRYNRFVLMFGGFATASVIWILYGVVQSLPVILVLSVLEGVAFACSYPAKQAFLVQVSPVRWLGSIQGLEQSGMQMAALISTLVMPLLYEVVTGYAIVLCGVLALLGLTVAAPVLGGEWRRLQAGGQAAASGTCPARPPKLIESNPGWFPAGGRPEGCPQTNELSDEERDA